MASFTPTIAIDDPRTTRGGNGGRPPVRDGGDDGRSGSGQPSLEMRLRRARLGLGAGLIGIVMVFVSFTSAYIVRQGLPTFDAGTNTLVHDWFPVPLPRLLLINTFVLLLSTLTMEMARRQLANETALAPGTGTPGVALKQEPRMYWLALTVLLGFTFLTGQWMVWRELAANGFYVSTSPGSSFVYLLTATHGVHLLGGILALLAAGAASVLRKPLESRLVIVDVTGWYWHFMAFLWIYVFCLLEFAG